MKRKHGFSKIRIIALSVIGFLITFLTFIGVSYAYYKVRTTNSETLGNINTKIDCLDLTYSESNVISLNNKYPITDEYALADNHVVPVTITVTNNCSVEQGSVNYVLTYTTLSENTGYIPDSKMRIDVKRKLNTNSEENIIGPEYISNLEALTSGQTYTMLTNDLANRNNVKNYTNKTNYVLDRASIGNGETNIYKVYLWIDYYEGDTTHSGNNDNSTENLNYKSALSLVLNSEKAPVSASTTLIALTEDANNASKISRYTGPVTDECSASSCTTVQQAQNVYIVKSNDINNVIFQGYCWKIIRTTETKGVKLLYNGMPITVDGHQECIENNGVDAQIGTFAFSATNLFNSPAYVGYMYNKTSGTLREILYADDVNKMDSELKNKLENWLTNTSQINEGKLEDSVWCNDRSLDSSKTNPSLDTTYSSETVYFKNRSRQNTLECTNITDSFNTLNEKAKTNAKVGFMTEPERYLMSDRGSNYSTVASGQRYWLGSPYDFQLNYAHNYLVWSESTPFNSTQAVQNEEGVRPVVSASSQVQITDGNGSTTSPFIFE